MVFYYTEKLQCHAINDDSDFNGASAANNNRE